MKKPLSSLDLNLLLCLQLLTQELSVTRTAKRMNVSPSAVSKSLAKLRAWFDDPLFVKTPLGLAPTPLVSSMEQDLADWMQMGNQILDKPHHTMPSGLKFELAAETPKSFIPAQFDNPANPEAHYLTTGPELWRDTDGCVDLFVAGIGTGGTFSGTGRYLKEKNPNVKLVAVEPAGSPLLSGGKAGPHGLMGIGANFIPKNMDISLIDEIICVREEDAYAAGRDMVACEGVLVGITAGAALWAATQLALRPENAGKTIVALLPDGGERYLSTPMYQGE